MKIRIAVEPDATHEVTIIERDRPSGRDLTILTGEPGKVYEFDLNDDTFVFTQRGQRLRDDDGDGGGGGSAGTGHLVEGLTFSDSDDDDLVTVDPDAEPLNERSTADEVASPAEPVTGSISETPPGQTPVPATQTDPGTAEGDEPPMGQDGQDQAGGQSDPGTGEQTDVGTGEQTDPSTEGQTIALGEPSDDDVRAVLADLESNPSVERTAQGVVQVTTINKALEAKGFKPINAARRDAIAAG